MRDRADRLQQVSQLDEQKEEIAECRQSGMRRSSSAFEEDGAVSSRIRTSS